METAAFTLLMSVYAGDKPQYFRVALRSCVQQQTLAPERVVLVQDGPVSAEMAAAVREEIVACPVPVELVKLPKNCGLAQALNHGLRACETAVVARMDADDVAEPERFAKQWRRLRDDNLDLLGTGMREFADNPDTLTTVRTPPTGARLREHAKTHNPVNHPTMMYLRDSVLSLGGYTEMGNMEDYWLVVRMLLAGMRLDNLREPLVRYRVGSGVYARRGGFRVAWTEVRLQWRMLRSGFISVPVFLRNIVLKTAYRLFPARLKQWLFRRFVAGGLRGDRS